MWLRYIDDLFFVWQGTEESLKLFVDHLNSRIPTIKFTLEYDRNQIHFLDVTVRLQDGKFSTDIYRKPTDRITYLNPHSFHPPSTIKGLPYSQMLRTRRIVSEDDKFEERAEEMMTHFESRGYGTDMLETAREKVKGTSRTTLLSKKAKKKSDRLPFVTTYSRQSGRVKKIIYRHWHLLQMDQRLKPWVAEPPMMAYKRSSNLRDHLVHALIEPQKKQGTWLSGAKGMFKCGRCVNCNFVMRTDKFYHPMTGREYEMTDYINCQTDYVIYMVKCPCGKVYVGETTRSLSIRIGEHRSDVRLKKHTSPLARHFMEANHQVSQLKFMGIERVRTPTRGGNREILLKQRELKWIYRLQTLSPNGLNEDRELSLFF
ncbi:uncharacterized protein LOC121395443 isoform X1 [Xenopus laevis]|uniref:Uncharacterized protein LOC121395443 isoform X1 n=1 Tax=Xenopus laevis TaxID=8355 RepID=A0A8J1L5X1_XENLA|nr:uncharacterized protein LOC121395443 isoform X1 [Xenopus laevis]XP_041424929.1 uncharacterized protein LOC121395443 isoform X1 [Xenopus laevis]